MKNKFEALKAFQSWPRDWQELCAEFWAESDTTFEARLDAKQSEANPVGLVLPAIGDPWPYDEPMPVRRAAAKRPVLHFMRYTRDELGEIDFYLSNGGRPLETARRMDKKHPGQRTVEAWEKMVHRVKKHGLEKMLENAIDMEVE
ncbi:MAG: hypothetical protein ACOVLE_06640 [Pirellula staleyi]